MELVVSVTVVDKTFAERAPANLNQTSNHFSYLIKQETLTFQVKVNIFHRARVLLVRELSRILVEVHISIGVHLYHVSIRSHFSCFKALRKVVIVFRAAEASPYIFD